MSHGPLYGDKDTGWFARATVDSALKQIGGQSISGAPSFRGSVWACKNVPLFVVSITEV